jgi:hypothetical protein
MRHLAQPLGAQSRQHGRHHARRDSQRHDLGALQALQRFPASQGKHHSERRDQPKLTGCTGGKSHPQNPRNHGAARAAY